MRTYWLWLLLTNLLTFSLLPSATDGVACNAGVILNAGLFFRCQLSLQDFSSSSDAAAADSTIVSYRVHQVGFAGRPSWVQAAVTGANMFLYGTPTAGDVGQIQLQVTVQGSDFQTSSRSVQLTVQPLQGEIVQVSDLYITNLNLEEILSDANYDQLETALREVYVDADPRVVTLVDPRDRSIETPQPPAKLGVVVQVTPGLDISTPLPTTSEQEANSVQGSCDSLTDLPLPPLNFPQFLVRGLAIDWCHYTLELMIAASTGVLDTPPTLPAVEMPTAVESDLALIVVMVVVGVVICMATCVLTCVCFCRRRDSLLTLPKIERYKRKVMLDEAKSSVYDVNKAQILLRHLSSVQGGADVGVALREERAQSAETCLEYQDIPDGRGAGARLESPPPPYCYDERLVETTRSSSPSSN